MFVFSKIVGIIIEPASLLLLLTVIALLLRRSTYRAVRRFARGLLILLGVCLFLLLVLPVGQWALAPLENRYAGTVLPDKVDGILLLTGDEAPGLSADRNLPVAGAATARYIHLARLAKAYPQARLVVVGDTRPFSPSGKLETKDIAKEILATIGVDLSRVTYETHSLNTRQNAIEAQKLVNPRPGEKWVVVTMAPHLPRAMLCFKAVGWDVIPSASDYYTNGRYLMEPYLHFTRNLYLLTIAAHEYYGLVSYRLLGWTKQIWP